ncbi:membrane protein [Gordoniibacillus kamchatkensis]|uniref:Membrane protein n=1 Tax=Gordoniibacillus kamchatkensis TaxID=1590651 RepID=A0ABR5A4Y7_9BACL|nr:membrane protein [Paenibacillus sp. VKM B-2647]KIL36086.1 membrane protein [Paenibacillus sp. VKM B-2647]
MKLRVGPVIKVAFTYVGTIVGAGFASGQEILQFYTRYGWMAELTIAFSSILFVWLGIKLMLIAYDVRAASYEDLNRHLFGERIGNWISLFTLIVLFGITSVMLAGSGSVFSEHLHLSYQTGLLVTLFASYFVIVRGMDAIMTVNSVVVPIMVMFTILLLAGTLGGPGRDAWTRLHTDDPIAKIWIAPLLYTSFNLSTAQAVLVPVGAAIRSRKVLILGGLIGGAMIGALLLAVHIALAAQMPGITQFEIPMAHLIRPFGRVLQYVYLLVIYGEIFTTYIANVYGIVLQLQQRTRLPRQALVVVILALSYLCGQFGFKTLLSTLYPIFGFISLSWLAMLVWRRSSAAVR